jgi:serine/threonine protein kinase
MQCGNSSYIDKTVAGGKCLSELFIWNAFESLVETVRYFHLDPADKGICDWDPVYHRDIVRGNILLDGISSSQSYPAVKLAGFGCAVTQLEMSAQSLTPADLPEVCPNAVPPEGPIASEATRSG